MLKEHEARVTLKQPLVARSARVTYDELRKDLLEPYQATGDRDLEEAGWRLKHLDRAFHGARASRIDGAAITHYIVQRQQEEIVSPTKKHRRQPANGTINREVSVLLRMLRLGLEHGKVTRLPIVHKPKEAAARSGFFEADAYAAVRGHLPVDLQVAVALAYTFGWRILDELLSLKLKQLDLVAGTVRLDPGSTRMTTAAWSISRRSYASCSPVTSNASTSSAATSAGSSMCSSRTLRSRTGASRAGISDAPRRRPASARATRGSSATTSAARRQGTW